MKLGHIVACSQNNAIGLDNALPWHIPDDLRYFMRMTQNSYIIMGRKTLESLKKPLKNRSHIVVTRNKDYKCDFADIFHDIEDAISFCKKNPYGLKSDIIFVTGGETIYKQTQDQMDFLYITRIKKTIDGDTFYPEPDLDKFELNSQYYQQSKPNFTFEMYTKKTLPI